MPSINWGQRPHRPATLRDWARTVGLMGMYIDYWEHTMEVPGATEADVRYALRQLNVNRQNLTVARTNLIAELEPNDGPRFATLDPDLNVVIKQQRDQEGPDYA